MVFNSYVFLFLFLPVVLALFFILGRKNEQWAAYWLLFASLCYYVSWDYRYLPILLTSMLLNYAACSRILAEEPVRRRKIWLTAALVFNLLMLGYFKYANFFIATINGLTGKEMSLLTLLLPMGISFFTFTQIALLVDAYQGKIQALHFDKYLLLVSYFPYIVAGPILHHKDMLPQFSGKNSYRPTATNFAVGVTLFVFGAAKKLLIADNLVPLVDVAFTDNPQFLQAWLGLFAYTLQLYFDFSGYSDMAIGVSRLFGFQIPFNFNSPYKASSVSDFWLRWHISLSRFLRNYLYIPLGGNRNGQVARYRNLLVTMLLGGLWHGANWTFVIWGGLHGLYLCVQHGWQGLRRHKVESTSRLAAFSNRSLTFLAVMIAWCFFRAPNVSSAFKVLAGLGGMNGFSLGTDVQFLEYTVLALGAFIAFYMPNTNELILYLDSRFANTPESFSILQVRWVPSIWWGVAVGVLLVLCLLTMEQTKDFIYAQF